MRAKILKVLKKMLFMTAHSRQITAYMAQQQMPVAKEGMEKMAPTAGVVAKEISKGMQAEIDEVKLTLAISNLVENGIKYNIEDGWVRVTLNADHKYFYINVSDSGIGIPEDSIDHVFERFYRVDKSHSTQIEGTGLGLAITRNAVFMHQGTIRVNSVQGEGTTFSIRIPLIYRVKGGQKDA